MWSRSAPTPETTKDKGKEERDVVLLGSICKNKIYVISFSVVLGPQALPEKLKAHFAGPSLSFYVKVWCVYSEVQPEALVSTPNILRQEEMVL